MASTLRMLPTWRPGAYLRSSGLLLFWMMVRALAMATLVVALSRFFGATGYGKFIIAVAIASFLVPFAGLGLSSILIRDGARKPESMDDLLASALKVWVWSAPVCMAFGCIVGTLMLTDGIPVIAAMVLIAAEIGTTSLVDLLGRAEQARHHAGRFGAINAGLPVARLVALVAYWASGHHTLGGWMWTYAAAGIAYAIAVYALLRPKARTGEGAPRLRIREGLPFGAAALSLRLQAEFNKPLLARIGFDQAAFMGVAQRALDLASLPLMAMQEALWSRLYAGNHGHLRARNAAVALVLLGFLTGVAVWLCAGLLPWLLGSDFTHAVDVVRMMAWLPLLQLLRSFSNFSVVAAHRTDIVGISYVFGALTALGLMATLIPSFGLKGAIAAAYLSDTTIVVAQQTMLRLGKKAPAEAEEKMQ